MPFGACPTPQAAYGLVDFHDDRPDVAKVGFHFAAAQVFKQSLLKLGFVGDNGGFQFLQLFDAPRYIEGCAHAEKPPLCVNNAFYFCFCIHHINKVFRWAKVAFLGYFTLFLETNLQKSGNSPCFCAEYKTFEKLPDTNYSFFRNLTIFADEYRRDVACFVSAYQQQTH